MAQAEVLWSPEFLDFGFDVNLASGHLSLHDYRKFLSQPESLSLLLPPRKQTLRRKPAASNLNPARSHQGFAVPLWSTSPPSSAPSSPPPLSFCPSVVTFQSDASTPVSPSSILRPLSRPPSQRRRLDPFRARLSRPNKHALPSHQRTSSDSALFGLESSKITIDHDGALFEIINPRDSLDASKVLSSHRSSETSAEDMAPSPNRPSTAKSILDDVPASLVESISQKFPSPTPGLLESDNPFAHLAPLQDVQPSPGQSSPHYDAFRTPKKTQSRKLKQKVSRMFSSSEKKESKFRDFFSSSSLSRAIPDTPTKRKGEHVTEDKAENPLSDTTDAGLYTWYDPESEDPFVSQPARHNNQVLEMRSRSISSIESIRDPNDFFRADTPSPWEQPNYHSSDEEAPYEDLIYPQVDVNAAFAYAREDQTASISQEVGAERVTFDSHPEEEPRITVEAVNGDSDEDSTPRQIESVHAAHDSDDDHTPTQLTFNDEVLSNARSNIAVGRNRALLNMEVQANRHTTLQDAFSEADDTASITYQDIVDFLRMTYNPQPAFAPPGHDDTDFVLSPSSAVLPRNEGDSAPSTRQNSPQKGETVDAAAEDGLHPASSFLPTVSSQVSLGSESARFSLQPYLQPAAAFMARSAPRAITSAGGLPASEQEQDKDDEEEDDENVDHLVPRLSLSSSAYAAPDAPPSRPSSATPSEEFSFVPSEVRIRAATATTSAATAAPPPAAAKVSSAPSFSSSSSSSELHVGSPQGISTSPPFHRSPGPMDELPVCSTPCRPRAAASYRRGRLHFVEARVPVAPRNKKLPGCCCF